MSQPPPHSTPYLTSQEYRVLKQLVDGRTPKEIARELALSLRTVNYYLMIVRQKLEARTLEQAVGRAVALHLCIPTLKDEDQ